MRRHPRLLILGLIAAVLIVGEVAVDRLEPYLPASALWADQATAVKVEQMRQRATTGCTDVVFAGSSMARDALDPSEFAAADPDERTAYNAALDAASPELDRRWLLDQVVPRLHPRTVVLGLASFDLNDHAPITRAALEAYEAAPLSATGRANAVQAWTTEHLGIVRARQALRSPRTVWESLGRMRRGEREDRPSAEGIDGVVAADGHGLSRRSQRYRASPGIERFVRDQLLKGFGTTGRQDDALRDLVRRLRQDGTEVVLLQLPVTDDYVALHPHGAADMAAFEDKLDAIAAATGATVVRAPDLDDASFADTHHLNGRGADALSQALPGLLADAGVPADRC